MYVSMHEWVGVYVWCMCVKLGQNKRYPSERTLQCGLLILIKDILGLQAKQLYIKNSIGAAVLKKIYERDKKKINF